MSGDNYRGIQAFVAVAQERSFTRAAARLGVSPSALSHTIGALEARLGLRLLTRTTRSVSPTQAGEHLMRTVAPRFEAIAEELAAFTQARGQPAGAVRIVACDFATHTILWPRLRQLRSAHPEIRMEIAVESGLTDIVAEGFDAGVRFGDQIARDMTAVRISPDIRMVIVGAPSYLQAHPAPRTPAELTGHECITMRQSPRGAVQAWELKKGSHRLQVRVEGAWTFNCSYPVVEAALAGLGLAHVPQELVQPHIESGRLQAVLKDWSQTAPGLHIFYASRRQSSPALSLVVEALRYRR